MHSSGAATQPLYMGDDDKGDDEEKGAYDTSSGVGFPLVVDMQRHYKDITERGMGGIERSQRRAGTRTTTRSSRSSEKFEVERAESTAQEKFEGGVNKSLMNEQVKKHCE